MLPLLSVLIPAWLVPFTSDTLSLVFPWLGNTISGSSSKGNELDAI